MKRNFDEVMEDLKETIYPSDFLVDFSKATNNISNNEINLNILNTLIGKENIEEVFESVIKKYPEVLSSIPILLATHENKIKSLSDSTNTLREAIKNKESEKIYSDYRIYNFKKPNQEIKEYSKYLKNSGLFDLLKDKKIKNLVDYVLGIEVGMDTNARKSRSGQIMETITEEYIKLIPDVEYLVQPKAKDIDNKYGTNLSRIYKATKKFDFAYISKVDGKIILVETNYYGAQGSKPNETARSYMRLNEDLKQIEGVRFVWITDGKGWIPSRNNLEDAYDVIEHLYIIKDLENGILGKI